MIRNYGAIDWMGTLCLLVACALFLVSTSADAWTLEEEPEALQDNDEEVKGEGKPEEVVADSATRVAQEVLTCEGGWRLPLYETRREIGPARLTRMAEIQGDIVLSGRAFAFCQDIMRSASAPNVSLARGACEGLLLASQGIERISENLFGSANGISGASVCLARGPRASGQCEHVREQLTSLRRYQRVGVQRAALVASLEVCAGSDRATSLGLRSDCQALEHAIANEATPAATHPGRFSLSAPLPQAIAQAVDRVRQATDSHFLNLVPENFLGVRKDVCEDSGRVVVGNPWSTRWAKVRHSLCAELSLATSNAETCREADIYIDERGQLHLSDGLQRRQRRSAATLCIDISDFDGDHPLMLTLGIAPKSSVPERVWPGETVSVGHWIDKSARAQDVLQLSVFGKARGVSLREVLRINGADATGMATGPANSEACRIARSWVPVVDHEVPFGPYSEQAVIPVDFGRGRDGETMKMREGTPLLVWVRNIEPAGAVLVEYADGQSVRYEPPPLLGKSEELGTENLKPWQHIRGASSSVALPLLPRRARYPGSRVLRLGSPAGGSEYAIRICVRTRSTAFSQLKTPSSDGSGRPCDSASVIVDEKIYVHGYSHMGVQLHVGYSMFRTPGLTAKRTAAARAAGADLYEIVEETSGRTVQDIAMLLAVYPFGRDPYDFSHRPWRASYWHHASLLVGFSVKKASFWEDVYLGGSLPLANGVSASVLAHFARRDVPVQTSSGQFLSIPDAAGDSLSLEDYVATQRMLSVGVGVGITFDLNLFQRAFSGVWQRIAGSQEQFYSNE